MELLTFVFAIGVVVSGSMAIWFHTKAGQRWIQQGACKLSLNIKEGVIQEALVETRKMSSRKAIINQERHFEAI